MAVGIDARGWTTFTQTNIADKIYYVSQSTGNDAWDGTQPAFTSGTTGPVKTLAAGKSLMQAVSGTASWLLLKAGDTWTDEKFGYWSNTHGRSATEPMVIGSYTTTTPGTVNPYDVPVVGGLAQRPMIKDIGDTNSIDGTGPIWGSLGASNCGDFMALVALEFYADKRDPASGRYDSTIVCLPAGAFAHITNYNWVLVEDCKWSFYSANNLNCSSGTSGGLQFRRNVVHDNYNGGSQGSQGLYLAFTNTPLVEDNVFDHNGWNETVAAKVAVTVSIASPCVVTWAGHPFAGAHIRDVTSCPLVNFFTTGALPPGLVDSNTAGTSYFVKNVIDANTFTISSTFGGAAIVTTGSQSGSHTAQYFSAAATTQNHNFYFGADDGIPRNGTVRNNITARAASHGLQHRIGGTVYNNLFANNSIAMNLFLQTSYVGRNVVTEGKDIDPTLPRGDGIEIAAGTSSSLVEWNIVANTLAANADYGFVIDAGVSAVQLNNNIVYSWGPGTTWGTGVTRVNNGTGLIESGNVANAGGNPDPTRTLARYAAEVCGLTGTIAAFMVEAKKQSKQNWRLQYTADGVNNWIRAGFTGAIMQRLRAGQFHG